MGNNCSSLGCSENLQFQNIPNEEKEREKEKNSSIYEKAYKPQITPLEIKYLHSNPTENSNKKNNLNGNRMLMFMKELPTKVVQDKIKQQFNKNSNLTSCRENNVQYNDDFQCKTLVKNKSDFEKVLDSDRKLFSRSLAGKVSQNSKNNYSDSFNIKKNIRNSNHLANDVTNNKNNNNDVIFIYGREKANANKKLLENPQLVCQQRINLKNLDLILSDKTGASEGISENNKELNLVSPKTTNDETVRNSNVNEIQFNDIGSNNFEKKNKNRRNNCDNNYNKISIQSFKILKYEKRKNNFNTSIEMINESIRHNPNILSFYLKNKNFERPDDIIVISYFLFISFFKIKSYPAKIV